MYAFTKSCLQFGLKANVKKTEVMSWDSLGHKQLVIRFDEDILKQIDKFRYLGNSITAESVLQPQHLENLTVKSSSTTRSPYTCQSLAQLLFSSGVLVPPPFLNSWPLLPQVSPQNYQCPLSNRVPKCFHELMRSLTRRLADFYLFDFPIHRLVLNKIYNKYLFIILTVYLSNKINKKDNASSYFSS